MSHGGAESGSGVPPDVAKFVAGQSQDGKASGPGGQEKPAPLFSTRDRGGLIESVTDQEPAGIPASAAPTGLTSVRATQEARQTADGPQQPIVDDLGSTPQSGQREPGQAAGDTITPNGRGQKSGAHSVFLRIQSTKRGPSLAEKPGEQGSKADDTAGGGPAGGEAAAATNGNSQEHGQRFGLPRRPQAETTPPRGARLGETAPPRTASEPQDDIPGRPREESERPQGRETDETQEHEEIQDEQEQRDETHARLVYETDRAPVFARPPQPPTFVKRVNERVQNWPVAHSMPDHPDTAAKRRSKITKYGAKVAHHLSTKAKEYGGLALSTIGGLSSWGALSGREQAVGAIASVVTGLLVWGSAKADFLPELLAFKYTAPVIGSTAATATLAELTATGVAPTAASEGIAITGGALIIWGAKDIYNKIKHGRLVKKDAANTDREFLTKLRQGTPGAGGEPGLFEIELARREDELKAANTEHKRLQSEHLRFYYESIDDKDREERLALMERNEPNRKRILDAQNERWRREAADRLEKMKPKRKGYMRTFWQSLTDTQRLAFEHAYREDAQQYIGASWYSLNIAQRELFARAPHDENLRQTFARMRPEWMKQAEEDLQGTHRHIKKQQRKVDLARGRHDRAIEIQTIVEAGKTPKGKLVHVENKKRKKGQPDDQPV